MMGWSWGVDGVIDLDVIDLGGVLNRVLDSR